MTETNDYGERLARAALTELPPGEYHFEDTLDNDGFGADDIPIAVNLSVSADGISVDFAGTSAQVTGNLNCPLSVAAAAVLGIPP